MTDSTNQWTESTSDTYRQFSDVIIPARAEQIATLLTLLPFQQGDTFRVVELASGEGFLSHAILSAFPNSTLLALDGSESMRETTSQRLNEFGERSSAGEFDMLADNWYDHLNGADCVVSSLCVHHLDDAQKEAMFAAVCERLSARGALLLADIIHPRRKEARELFASTWEAITLTQAVAKTGDTRLFDRFVEDKWNMFRYSDPMDKPSTLFDQLQWLKQAGFAVVDCFWMQAGHAIYGGYKTADDGGGIAFDEALRLAKATLEGEL